eukprot:3371307-Prymnesium_polylepis.1
MKKASSLAVSFALGAVAAGPSSEYKLPVRIERSQLASSARALSFLAPCFGVTVGAALVGEAFVDVAFVGETLVDVALL